MNLIAYNRYLIGFKRYVRKKNVRIKNKKLKLESKAMYSKVISEGIVEDINLIQKLQFLPFSVNCILVNMVMRNICEQVIEYLYIMKNKDLISDFFGGRIKYEEEEDANGDLFKLLRKGGGARYEKINKNGKTSKRKSFAFMAEHVDEGDKDTNDNKISLYTIYRMTSDIIHNSYFYKFRYTGKYFKKDKDFLRDINSVNRIYMIFIIDALSKVYKNI